MTTPKAQHTPRPWTIRERPAFVIEADGHVGPILEMRSPLDLPAWDPVAQATRQANARLIAESPMLLLQLESLVEFVDGIDKEWIQELAQPELEKARAVIAKVRGVTPC